MNRRLIREVYLLDRMDSFFTHGIPSMWSQEVSGSSAVTTYDYTHAYGSHLSLTVAGALNSYAKLKTKQIAINNVKAIVFTAEDVTLSGNSQFNLAVKELSGTAYISIALFCDESTQFYHGSAKLVMSTDGVQKSEAVFADIGKAIMHNLDLGIEIDVQSQLVKGCFDYLYKQIGPSYFPSGKILTPVLEAFCVVDGSSGVVQVRRATLEIYK